MTQPVIFFVPGKNPKPPAEQHRSLLWRSLLEGIRRADPTLAASMQQYSDNFHLIAWNPLYYHTTKDLSRDLPWIDALINQHGPTPQDIAEANGWHRKLSRLLFNIADRFPFLIRWLPAPIRSAAEETRRYFQNHDNIGCEIREMLKHGLRPLLENDSRIMLIGHSLGSVIAYDTLWELSHEEKLTGKIDLFLTLGSPLGMNYVQKRLQGIHRTGPERYPLNIHQWISIASVGDVTALDRCFANDFKEMLELRLVDRIEDHCEGIYNFFRNEQGLNCHRSYGYLVNPAVGKVIAHWWQSALA